MVDRTWFSSFERCSASRSIRLFVKRDDQVVGLTNLLSLAVRFLTLIEFVVRRKLKQNQEKLVGLIENNPKKGIDNPTTERLLKMFDNITLTIVQLPDQTIRHVTPLIAIADPHPGTAWPVCSRLHSAGRKLRKVKIISANGQPLRRLYRIPPHIFALPGFALAQIRQNVHDHA